MHRPEAKSFKQLTISVEKLPASMAQQERQTAYAAERARILLGCYRTGEANDPETYVAAIAAVLARFSEDVVTQVTHPVEGLPRLKSWLPTVKEVFDACREATLPKLEREREERIIAETLARRAAEVDKSSRPTREELQEKYGSNWGLKSLDEPKKQTKPAPTADQLRDHYSKYNLGYRPKEGE
jgi:hypothetical protein